LTPKEVPSTSGGERFFVLVPTLTAYIADNVRTSVQIGAVPDVDGS
jgi:hypothetical protein